MNDDKEKSIDEILKGYSQEKSTSTADEIQELAPPVRRQASENENAAEEAKEGDSPKKKKIKLNKKALKKILLTVISVIAAAGVITGGIFAVKGISQYKKTAYLKPYQEKYPGVDFPEGILKEYCDEYGKNPDLQGLIKIPDLDNKAVYLTSGNTVPVTEGAQRFSYSVSLDSNELEAHYKNAEAYNKSKQYLVFSDLFDDYTYQIAGAFYINTKPEDDDGYIFPYNTTEKMTEKSFNSYFDRLKNRLIYTVDGMNVSPKNTLLTISMPTDYKKDYRFVIVAKLTDKAESDRVARDKKERRLTESEYREQNKENPYGLAAHWYPEILVKDENGSTKKLKKTVDDYK